MHAKFFNLVPTEYSVVSRQPKTQTSIVITHLLLTELPDL